MKKFILFTTPFILILALIICAFTNKDNQVNRNETLTINPAIAKNLENDTAIVYMTKDISSNGLMAVYNALGRKATGKVAVKLHSGEPGGNHYLHPELIKELVQTVNGTIVESNTAYGGGRASTAMHKQVMIDHGFTAIASTDIMDENGHVPIPVPNGKNITQDFVGAHLLNYDFLVVLSHFKGHAMGGFGGAIKNMSIGIASTAGKCWIHTAGRSMTSPWNGAQDPFLESMAEAAFAVADTFNQNIIYISVMNNLSVDCDCDNSPAAPTMKNIGILASLDPVALDQACVDLVYAASDGRNLIQRMESRNAIHTLEHGEAIGFGTRKYNLLSIDSPTTSVNKLATAKVNIFPTTATDLINIPTFASYDLIYLFDMQGKQIGKFKSNPSINIENLGKGKYIAQFIKNSKLVGVSTFIKK
jgi:uncharacterized Fe-S center protein